MTVLLSFKDEHTFKVDVGPRDTALCRQVPGMRAGKLDVKSAEVEWTCPATWYHAIVTRNVFGARLEYTPAVQEWGWRQLQLEEERLALKTRDPRDITCFSHDLRPFQVIGAAWLLEHDSILADDMGLGKTVQSLQALDVAHGMLPEGSDALVVTTSSMKYKFADEAARWAPEWESIVVIDGSAAKRAKLIDKAPSGTLFVINWESLRLHTRQAGYGSIALTPAEKAEKELNRRQIRVVVADEAHRSKDPKSKQTRSLWAVAKDAVSWAMTGTPVANVPNDLWALLHLMDPVVWASRSAFQDRYVYGFQADWGFEPIGWRQENKDELFRFVDLYMLRRSKAEVLTELPAKTYETRVLELTPKQATAYKDMKKEMMTTVGGDLLTTDNVLTQLIRLQQIASATPIVIEGNVIGLEKPSNKAAALLEILAEGDETEPVVVFAQSRKLIDLCESELERKGISSVRITGNEGAELRALNVQTFQEGRVRVALCTFGAGSEGITLTAASTAVFLQRPWSLIQSRQAEDRIHRMGQEASKVLIIDLISKGTVDAKVHEALVVKGENLESVVRDRERLAGFLA